MNFYSETKKSLARIFFEKLQEYGDLEAFINGETHEVLTYKELFVKSVRLASALRRLGLKKGAEISILSENDIYYFIPYLACLYNGYILHHLNPDYTTYELKHYMTMTQPKIVFTSKRALANVVAMQTQFPLLETIIILNGEVEEFFINLDLLIKLGDMDNFHLEHVEPNEQVACIFNSSGTTGLPKGVMLTHDNLKFLLTYAKQEFNINISKHFATICVVPCFHVFGSVVSIPTLFNGGKIVILPKFKPELYLETIERYAVEKLYIVPPLASFLIKNELVHKYNLKSIKTIYCGAAILPVEVSKLVYKKIGVRICQFYGLTETTGPIVFNSKPKEKYDSVGVLLDKIEGKVINPENGAIRKHNEMGELCFKGYSIMKGYKHNVDSTLKTIDSDGYLHTGDLGYIDADGFIYVIDRIKDVIKHKGFQVAPAEIEGLLMTHEAVEDVAVIGIPDERAGEKPFAFVVRKDHFSITANEIISYVAQNLSYHKHICGVKFVQSIPKTASGKIIKTKLFSDIVL